MKLEDLVLVRDNIELNNYIKFREEVKSSMEHPEWLGDFSKEDLEYLINNGSTIWIWYNNADFVCSMMAIPANKEDLKKFKLDLDYKKMLDYGPMMVNPKYVGNGLQYQMLLVMEKFARENGYKYGVSTIHPDNIYSINNLEKNNFIMIGSREFSRGLRNIYYKEIR